MAIFFMDSIPFLNAYYEHCCKNYRLGCRFYQSYGCPAAKIRRWCHCHLSIPALNCFYLDKKVAVIIRGF